MADDWRHEPHEGITCGALSPDTAAEPGPANTWYPCEVCALTLTFRETNSDDEPIGPTRCVPLGAIDAIVIY